MVNSKTKYVARAIMDTKVVCKPDVSVSLYTWWYLVYGSINMFGVFMDATC